MAIVSIKDKATQIMDGLLLSQYKDSPLLRSYLLAYVSEMDLLFQNIEEVHFGRFLEHAIGVQLDIIGKILQQDRNIDLGATHFGFIGATLADSFGDLNNAGVGSTFISLEQSGNSVPPLDDETYRRVLRCKANALSRSDDSIEFVYTSVSTLIGRVPKLMVLTEPSNLTLNLELLSSDVSVADSFLIDYMSKYFVPASITFNITLT